MAGGIDDGNREGSLMCGIAGILKLDPRVPAEETRLKRMLMSLRHRGPDGEGRHVAGPIALGHRRLAIVDPTGGRQPMTDERQSRWLVCNGEIYNHPELRARLQASGHQYRSASDNESIVHLHEEEGDECVRSLRGMFAFAVWDAERGRLILARDRLGIKPLYYAINDQEIVFASEIKAILAAGGFRAEMNESVLPEYLASRFVSGAETFFRGIRKLLPGRMLRWSLEEGVRLERWWTPPSVSDLHDGTLADQAVKVRASLDDSVRRHLMSDVPLGLFLSGGLDSTAIAALAARAMDRPLKTFSVGFAEQEANETDYARLAAKGIGADHHEVFVTSDQFFSALPQMVWYEDEPVAFDASIPLYFLSRLAAEHVKVVLTGEGADELFLGYNRYRVTAWNEALGELYWRLVPSTLRGRNSPLIKGLPRIVRRYAERSFLGLDPGPRELFCENFAVFPTFLQRHLLSGQRFPRTRDPYDVILRAYEEADGDSLDRMARADLQTYLVELLMKQDQMSMAASIESRVPYLDHPLVEQVLALPSRFKLRGWRTKAVLRTAVKDLVPRTILERRKAGFPVPLSRWLREARWPVVQEFVLSPRALRRGWFDPTLVRTLAQEHRSGTADHSGRLWLLINLEIWQRIFLEGESPAAIPIPAAA
ncbi:MAG TPA: asparagine synthase (glutamine-hydrolyzing) [Candidatus Polarisedimenticolia bacterium]|nr:asparagine synthase (glutamine-hydrolyzing) [Candidatus Polarisedimenticolia bacterium]